MTLVRTGFICLPAGSKRSFDHADVYRAGQRLYVAHTGADRVDVIDCSTQAYTHAIPDLPGVAGVLVDNEQDLSSRPTEAAHGSASSPARRRRFSDR